MGSNLIRAEWLRLTKSLYGYACVAGFAALTLAVVMANADHATMANGTGGGDMGARALSPFEAYDLGFLLPGTAVVLAGWMVTELVGGDYYSGTVKNMVQTQGGRQAYGAMVVFFVIAASALLAATGIACTELGCWFEGVTLTGVPFGERVLWYVQVVMCVAAYTMVTAWAIAATGNRAVGMALALALGLGVFNTTCSVVFEGLGVTIPAEGRYVPGSLGGCVRALREGALLGWEWIIPVAVVFGVGVFGLMRALKRKELA